MVKLNKLINKQKINGLNLNESLRLYTDTLFPSLHSTVGVASFSRVTDAV